jgi:hypothetical protein
MPIAYCVRSAPVNDDQVSESTFTVAKPANVSFNEVFGRVGKDTDKTPRDRGWNIQYDTAPVPLDAQVIRSKIVLTADSNESSVFDSLIWRYKDGSSPNLDSVTETIHQQFKWLARVRDTASTELARSSITGTFDFGLDASMRGATAAGQVLILSTAGNGFLGSVSMWLGRVFGSSFTGTCVAKVYATSGASGLFTRGSLLATSSTRPTTDIPLIFPGEFTFTLPSPLPVTSGQVMIVEVSFDPEPTGLNEIIVVGDTGFSADPDNALLFGPSMQAFDPAVYMNGTEQSVGNQDRDIPSVASERFTFPTFVAGDQYEIGDALYSPDVVLPNFTRWVQEGLDGRGSSNRLSFSILPDFGFSPNPPTSGEERRWRSGDHATPQIVDGNSLFGTVLVVEYAGDAIGHIVQISDPEVAVGIATASVQVAVPGPTAIATVQTASKTVAIRAATHLAEVPAATLAARVPGTSIAAEVATASIPARLSNATAVATVREAMQTAAIGPATLTAQVQAAALVVEVRTANLAVRIAVSPAGGPATGDTVGETLDISPTDIDVEVTRRDSTPFSFTLQDEDAAPIDITGYDSFTLTVDPSEEPSDATANLFRITAAFPSPGTGVITFSPSILDHTQNHGEYFFDVEQIDGSANVRTIIKGKYTILPDITQP